MNENESATHRSNKEHATMAKGTVIQFPDDQVSEAAIESTSAKMTKLAQLRQEQRERQFRESLEVPAKGERPKIGEVRAGDVRFDSRYQTDDRFNFYRARKLASGWNWNKFRPIDINIRPEDPNGTPWCPDGRHRTEAAIMRFGLDVRLPARVTRVPYTEEAQMFAYQDEGKRRVGDALKFNAEKEGAVADALDAQALLDRLGLKLGHRTAHRQVASNSFLQSYRMKGPKATEAALRMILDRWDGDAESLDSRIVKGATWFMAAYQDDPTFRRRALMDALREVSVVELMRRASKYDYSGEHKRVAAALVYFYNYKRVNRLPDWTSQL